MQRLSKRSKPTTEPVQPPNGEAHARIDEAGVVDGEGARNGHVGGHLAQANHDRVHDGADEEVGQQTARGPCCGQSASGSNEETSAYSAANGEEHQVARREAPVQLVRGGVLDRVLFRV